MADNLTTQSATPATVPAAVRIATREVTYSGDTLSHVAPVGLVTLAGADDAKTATDVSASNPLPVSDAAGSLTVDAPVATPVFVRLSDGSAALATLPVSLAAVPLPSGASTETTLAALNTKVTAVNTGAVVVSSSALPSGASTETTLAALNTKTPSLGQTTMAASSPVTLASNQSALPITDAAGSLTVDAPVATPVFVRLSDGTAALATLPVSLAALPALATGTNSVGDVRSITTSVIPGTSATHLGKAEDAVHATGDTGVMALAVRSDTAAALTSASGDYAPLIVDALNRLHVTLSANIRSAFGARTTVAITLASLGTLAAQQSDMIDTLDAMDLIFRVRTQASGATTAICPIYAYSSLGDATYTDGASGSNAAFTIANRLHAVLVGTVQLAGASSVITSSLSIARAFGGILPPRVGFIFQNGAAIALDATAGNHVFEYQTVVRAA